MKRNNVLQLLLLGIILSSLSNSICCFHHKKLSQKNDDLTDRLKRGLALLVPFVNDSSDESNEQENSPDGSSSEIKASIHRKVKRSSQEYPDSSEIEENRSTTDISKRAAKLASDTQVKSFTDKEGLIQKLTEIKESRQEKRRATAREAIRKLKRMRKAKNKKLMCVCEEENCKGRQCTKNQGRDADSDDYNDEYDEDTSAEETDDDLTGGSRPTHRYAEKARPLSHSEPTKFNIPFANNINFDQRVILGHKDVPNPLFPPHENPHIKLQPNQLFPGYSNRPYAMEYPARNFPVVKPVYATPKSMNKFGNSPITLRPNYGNGPFNYSGLGKKANDFPPRVEKGTTEYVPIYTTTEMSDGKQSNNGTQKPSLVKPGSLVTPKYPVQTPRPTVQKPNAPKQSNSSNNSNQTKFIRNSTPQTLYSSKSKGVSGKDDEEQNVGNPNDMYAYSTDIPNDSSTKGENLQYATSKTASDPENEVQSTTNSNAGNSRLLKDRTPYVTDSSIAKTISQLYDLMRSNLYPDQYASQDDIESSSEESDLSIQIDKDTESDADTIPLKIITDANSSPSIHISTPNSDIRQSNGYYDKERNIIIRPPDSYGIESANTNDPNAFSNTGDYYDNTPAANNQYVKVIPSSTLKNLNDEMATSNSNKQKTSTLRNANNPKVRIPGYQNGSKRNLMPTKSPNSESNIYQNTDPDTLFKGLERILMNHDNIDDESQEASTESDDNNYSTNMPQRKLSTENSIQAVDDNPIPHNFPRYNSKGVVEPNNNQYQDYQDTSNYKNAMPQNTDAVLQNTVRKVLNNFVPGKAEDLSANYNHENVADIVRESIEGLLPEIMNTPVLRSLFSVPEVEEMITEAASNLLTRVTGLPIVGDMPDMIKSTLRNIVNEIPEPRPTSSPANRRRESGRWVTERVRVIKRSKIRKSKSIPQSPPKEVFDKIQSIIKKSGLDEEATAYPVAQNLIVKAVKHSLDREKGAVDEFTIRRAMDMIVQSKKDDKPVGMQPKDNRPFPPSTGTTNPGKPLIVQPKELSDRIDDNNNAANNYQWPASQGKKPLIVDPQIQTTEDIEDYKLAPLIRVTERNLLKGGSWSERNKNIVDSIPRAENAGYDEERRKQLMEKLKAQNAFDVDSTEDPNLGMSSTYSNYSDDDDDNVANANPQEDEGINYYPSPTEYDTNIYSTDYYDTQTVGSEADPHTTEYLTVSPNKRVYDYMDMTEDPRKFYKLPSTETPRPIYHTTKSPLETIKDKIKDRLKILIESRTDNPTEDSIEEKIGAPRHTTTESLSSPDDDPSYMGKLVPLDYSKGAEPQDLSNLEGSNLVYVGDGVRLPLTVRKLNDGSFALTLSDDICKQFEHKRCPCCLPGGVDGVIMRERRSRNRTSQKNFAEDEANEDDFNSDRVRRDSTEMNEIMDKSQRRKNTLEKINNFLKKNKKLDPLVKDSKEMRTNLNNYKQFGSEEYSRENRIDDWSDESSNSIGPPYKYQRKAIEDDSIRVRTNAVKSVLNWIKEAAIKTPPPKSSRKKRASELQFSYD